MLSEVPDEWAVEELGNVLSILKNGYSCKQIKAPIDGYVPVSRIETISGGYINNKKVGFVPYEEKLEDFRIFKGDILFSHINSIEHVGKIAISDSDQKIYHAMNLLLMRPDKSKVQPNYLAEVLRWDITRDYYREHSKRAVNQVSLNQKNISAYEFALPPLTEQKRIAEVLSSVDESIQATQRLIEQAERVKQGLMEELLTGGLGSEAIERGEVPEGWRLVKQGDVAKFFNGRAYKLSEWEKSGTPVIRLQNLTGRGKDFYYSTMNLPKHQYCHKGDLLYMWSASFGAYIWQGEKAIFHYHIWKVEQVEGELDKLFHYYLLWYYTESWKKGANGMAMLHLTKKGMEELKIVIPKLEVQQEIANKLTDVDNILIRNKSAKEQLQLTKKGLMDDLLTGKVRTL